MPPLKGGIKTARIGARMQAILKGKRVYLEVREAAQFPNAKKVARCLGMRDGPALVPCSICQEAPVKGELGFDELRAKHPTPEQLRKSGEQHVFALWSDDLLDPEGYAAAKAAHDDQAKALAASKDKPLERQALIAQWGGYPREPWAQPIGLLSDASWADEE
jgi:hypothetical protein